MGKRKTTAPPSSSKPPDDGELDVEEFLEKNVERCRMKVDRLERDFSALIAHESLLNESFSVSTFPQGYDPVTRRFGNAVVASEDLNENVASKAAGKSKQRQSPASRLRNEVESADGADRMEEAVPMFAVRDPIPTETLSSSTSASDLMEGRNVMNRTSVSDIDSMKDEIRRERPGVKTPRKSPGKPIGSSAR